MMNQPDATEWREQMLHRLEKACQDSHSDLNRQIQELIKNMKDKHEQEQHRRKVLEEIFSAFKIQLITGAYDQQSLDEVDAQMSDILLIKHNLLIFDRYIEARRPSLLAYARTLTNLIEAEDLLSDASVAACKAFNKDPQIVIKNLDAWFHRILQNTSKNKYREATAQKRGIAESLEAREEEHTLEVEDDEDDQPEMALLRRESQETVGELILHLPLPYRRTMTLYLLHNWSVRQIADHCKFSVDTAKSHIRRSLPLLRSALLKRNSTLFDAYILTLPTESQPVMKLFLILGPNHQEIAKQLGEPYTYDTVTACIDQHLPSLFQLLLTQAS